MKSAEVVQDEKDDVDMHFEEPKLIKKVSYD